MKTLRIKQLALISIFFLIACQEDSIVETPDQIDEDMLAAISLADDYLKATSARGSFEDSDKSITVLKYKEGKLLFDTNTDDYIGYQEVVETSITAQVKPGEYIFWFSGGGLSEVDSIDFDTESQEALEDLPEDFVPSKMWVVRIPAGTPSETTLKYDIVYVPKGHDIRIRLDPKIGVMGSGDTSESSGDTGG